VSVLKNCLLLLVAFVGILVMSQTGLGADLNAPDAKLIRPIDTLTDVKLVPIDRVQEKEVHYLIGNFDQIRGTVNTDAGPQQTSFRGEIAFQVISSEKNEISLILKRLNLVSEGVFTKRGDSGVIGLVLKEPEYKTDYNSRTGEISADFGSELHYSLIDDIKGFIPGKSEECAVFYSYTEEMAGQLKGNLPESLQLAEKGSISMQGEIRLELEDQVLGALTDMMIVIDVNQLFWEITEPAEIFKVQPVFIGSGATDPTATGTAFNTLIDRSLEIWSRCGTVRCIAIRSNQPIYVDNDAYRVLNSQSEAADLRAEVDVSDALEVFVVERWDPFYDGGGATWGSGTASVKIVTCDQQLAVPCPPPEGLWGCDSGSCGDVNYFHLAHEIGHALSFTHPGEASAGRPQGSTNSIMEPSGFCHDNPDVQSAHNCRSASNPMLYWGRTVCTDSPDIMD
jgi:hypothetical protein